MPPMHCPRWDSCSTPAFELTCGDIDFMNVGIEFHEYSFHHERHSQARRPREHMNRINMYVGVLLTAVHVRVREPNAGGRDQPWKQLS